MINKYSNSDKQVLNKHTIVILAINSGNSIDMKYLWVIVINNSDKQVGLYSGGLIFGGGGAYIGRFTVYVLFHCTLCFFDKSNPSNCFSYESISLSWYYLKQIMNVYECNGKNIFIR